LPAGIGFSGFLQRRQVIGRDFMAGYFFAQFIRAFCNSLHIDVSFPVSPYEQIAVSGSIAGSRFRPWGHDYSRCG
jgi:hypothetical protein